MDFTKSALRTILAAALLLVAPIVGGCDDGEEGSEDDEDLSCLAQACVNGDGNTHTDCGCDADYCVPDVSGTEYLGVTALTCTVSDCDTLDCPEGYECLEVPAFVQDMLMDDGIEMPQFLCGQQ